MPSKNALVQKQLISIHMYPAFNVEILALASSVLFPWLERACWMSAHAATTLLSTMSPKLNSVMRVTEPPNQSTSP